MENDIGLGGCYHSVQSAGVRHVRDFPLHGLGLLGCDRDSLGRKGERRAGHGVAATEKVGQQVLAHKPVPTGDQCPLHVGCSPYLAARVLRRSTPPVAPARSPTREGPAGESGASVAGLPKEPGSKVGRTKSHPTRPGARPWLLSPTSDSGRTP